MNCQYENKCREQSGKGGVPDPGVRKNHPSGKDGPNPSREDRHRSAANSPTDAIKREADQRGEKAVQEHRGIKRREGEGPEDFRDSGNEQRIDGSNPRGGTSRLAEDTAKAFPFGQSSGYVAYFVLERRGGEDFGRNEMRTVEEVRNAKEQSDRGDEPRR